MSGRRQERVADLIRDEVMEIIQREMSDPRLGFVSITHVELSPDMKYARILISVFGNDDEQAQTLVALNNASGFIRRHLAPRLRMRVIPDISFRLDRSMAHAENVARILRELEPELRAADEQAAADEEQRGQAEDEEKAG
jgi:ribosome-binding factor A